MNFIDVKKKTKRDIKQVTKLKQYIIRSRMYGIYPHFNL